MVEGPRLVRVVTDGDLRRATLAGREPSTLLSELPSHEPICAAEGDSAARLMELMNQHVFDHIPVVGADRRLIDFISRRELSQRIWLSSPHLGEDPPFLASSPWSLFVLGILAILLGRASWRASESRPNNGDVPPG